LNSVRVCAQQLAPEPADFEGNAALATDAVCKAIAAGAQLVVLPELMTSGYPVTSEEAASVAVRPDHPIFSDWAREAAKGPAVVVAGFCEAGDDGHLYNSAAVVDKSGVLGVYRKTHLWDEEKFQPTITAVMAAASASAVFIVCCDRAGSSRGVEFAGASVIVDAGGWVVATPDETGTVLAVLDLEQARQKGRCARNHAFEDRRPDIYTGLGASIDLEEAGSRTGAAPCGVAASFGLGHLGGRSELLLGRVTPEKEPERRRV
jgi:predicted amidohydrolase